MSKGRLEAFSDGVIAILITIMVLELRVPEGADWAAVAPLVPVFLTYVMSFVVVGIYWNNHHHMLQAADRINGKISPIDGTVWQSSPNVDGPTNKLYKFDPTTNRFKDYPLTLPGRLPHGIDFSTDGMIWFSAGSGHLGRFDPKTEKFAYWDLPGVKFKGTGKETGSTEYPYFLWVDQFDTLGFGKDTVIVTGMTSDSMQIFDSKTQRFTVFRMPYPMPFYTRGLDGRIDDARAGWKGRGLWATYSSYMPKFSETKIGSINHIQLRPNPLAN